MARQSGFGLVGSGQSRNVPAGQLRFGHVCLVVFWRGKFWQSRFVKASFVELCCVLARLGSLGKFRQRPLGRGEAS